MLVSLERLLALQEAFFYKKKTVVNHIAGSGWIGINVKIFSSLRKTW